LEQPSAELSLADQARLFWHTAVSVGLPCSYQTVSNYLGSIQDPIAVRNITP